MVSEGVSQNMETAAIRALILSLCAGMSTLLGALVVMVIKKSEKLVSISLGFAAGIMISVSLTDLYPNATGRNAGPFCSSSGI